MRKCLLGCRRRAFCLGYPSFDRPFTLSTIIVDTASPALLQCTYRADTAAIAATRTAALSTAAVVLAAVGGPGSPPPPLLIPLTSFDGGHGLSYCA